MAPEAIQPSASFSFWKLADSDRKRHKMCCSYENTGILCLLMNKKTLKIA